MTWNGSGTYTSTDGTRTSPNVHTQRQGAALGLDAAGLDAILNDLTAGINTCLTKDVQNSPSAHPEWACSEFYVNTTGGSSSNYTVTLPNAPAAYYAGLTLRCSANHDSTGSSATLNVNSLGAQTIKTINGDDVPAGGIKTSQMMQLVYDGTNFVLLSALNTQHIAWTNNATGGGSMTWTTTTPTSSVYYVKDYPRIYVHLNLIGTTSGTAAPFVKVDAPIAMAAAEDNGSLFATVDDGTRGNGHCDLDTSAEEISIYKEDRSNFSLAAGIRICVRGYIRVA